MESGDHQQDAAEQHRNEVPFRINQNLDCGPVSLAMAAEYLGLNPPLSEIQQLAVSETGGVTWTLGLAAAAAQLGLKTYLCSTNLGANPANFELSYYQAHASDLSAAQKKLTALCGKCLAYGARLEQRTVTLEEIRAAVRAGQVPIALLDWNVFLQMKGYVGHFVPIVGYTVDHLLVHNPGPLEPTPFLRIPNELFERARMAPGTDEDILYLGKPTGIPS